MTVVMPPAEQAAYERLLTHGATCPTCRTVDETGGNANLPCTAGEEIYQAYRQTLRGPAAAPRNGG
ncbi:hypothetical protein [Streptomyces sp. ME18-1-4]|uniref:hypothetical protein n=1 Tax=Streptomyces sp. ME18-1-4 TaxID=3028685 RepID=UPI0029A7EC69|nr:hypothetical protein [Streptomyces sp. ME18-1-4]MDX3243685.1 hypothetical protein [Streptomyces sp. ME18-1-4]